LGHSFLCDFRRISGCSFILLDVNMANPLLKLSLAAPLAAALIFCLPCAAAQASGGSAGSSASGAGKSVVITLDEAIRLAQGSDAAYAASAAASRVAGLDRSIALGSLLPSVAYNNSAIYTQGNGQVIGGTAGETTPGSPRFISSNGVHEYVSQASVNETIGLSGVAGYRRADAEAAKARAEAEIARRGLVVTVTGLFFSSLAADQKLAVAERAHQEASDFVRLTTQRETARESAHADVVKAQLEEQQTARGLSDARVEAEKAHLELGVLIFADPRTACTLSAPEAEPALASREDVQAAAGKNNPELKRALASLKSANAGLMSSWAGLAPDLGVNYTYGIDAPQFAVSGPDHISNLGHSASVSVNIPIWDWLGSENKVRQSRILRDAAQVALTAAERRLIAQLDETYSEAVAARDQLASLDLSASTAAESLRLVKLAYQAGEATVLEVVDAQAAYVNAENARADGRVRYETALAELETLTGTK
jgi:outer membrane protein TolC